MSSPSKKVRLGQFYTSAAVARLMVSMAATPPDARVLEPSCGPGVFLSELWSAGYRDIVGYDIDPDNVAAARAACPGARVECADFLSTPAHDRFDLVIGNPPYVRWNAIEPAVRERLSADPFWAALANGEWDLLYAFVVWSVEKLRPGGRMLFIVPSNWLVSTHAGSLRRYLAERGSVEAMIDFGETRLFADCAPNALIVRYRKGPIGGAVWCAAQRGRARADAVLSALAPAVPTGPAPALAPVARPIGAGLSEFGRGPFPADAPWAIAPGVEIAHAAALEAACQGTTLADVAQVGVGVVSGYDAAYLLSDDQAAAVPAAEAHLVRRFAKAGGCRRHRLTHTQAMLFPEGLDESDLQAHPWAAAHLAAHRARLEARHRSASRPWFAWATVRNLEAQLALGARGRLFVPTIDRAARPRFAYTDQPVLAGGDVLVIAPAGDPSPDAALYLSAWLNGDAVARWWDALGARTGERRRYTQAHVARIPVLWPAGPAQLAARARIADAVRAARAGDPGAEARIETELAALIAGRAAGERAA